MVQQARKAFQTGRSKPLDFRIQQLKNLQRFILEKQNNITDALKKDLGKVNCNQQYDLQAAGYFFLCYMLFCFTQSENGTLLYEILGVEGEINLALSKLAEWAAPRPVARNLLTISDEVYIRPEPLGVVLIIGAWNYPIAVTLQPLVGAIAAGKLDRVVLTKECYYLQNRSCQFYLYLSSEQILLLYNLNTLQCFCSFILLSKFTFLQVMQQW